MYYQIDREDLDVKNGVAFRVKDTSNPRNTFDELKDKLLSPEFGDFLIEHYFLLDKDKFNGDTTYRLKRVDCGHQIDFVFENDSEDTYHLKLQQEYIALVDFK